MNRTSGGFWWLYYSTIVVTALPSYVCERTEQATITSRVFSMPSIPSRRQKGSGFNLEHWGLNWVYGAKPSVWDGNSVVRLDWPFLGFFFKLSACCPKGQTSLMLGIIINIIIIVNTIVIIISVIEAQYGAGVWLKVTWYGLDHHLQSPSSLVFSPKLHLFGGVGTALSFLRTDRWLHQTMSKCLQRWSLEATVDA